VTGQVEVILDQSQCSRMGFDVTNLSSFVVQPEIHYAPTIGQVLHFDPAEFRPAHPVVKENRQNGSVPFSF
jgi:hypothetical protein